MYDSPLYIPAGDSAVVVEIGNEISPEINRKVRNFMLALESRDILGVIDLVPSYRSLLVCYDPLVIGLDQITKELKEADKVSVSETVLRPKVVHVPVLYGGDAGPDLNFVGSHNGLTEQAVIDIHTGTDYLVYMLGFSPGFPYLGGMPETISTPRLDTPRTVIPAGSVGIAENQTGVYPSATPGGWRLIGKTPLKFFDPTVTPPALVDPGDYIRFVSITKDQYGDTQERMAKGTYEIVTELVAT